jgi:hypothetical protein
METGLFFEYVRGRHETSMTKALIVRLIEAHSRLVNESVTVTFV